jgi:hypothetical protein
MTASSMALFPPVRMPVTSSHLFSLYLFHVHVFFSIVALVGVCLLYNVFRAQPIERQRVLALRCLFLGGIGILVTVPFCLAGWRLLLG